MKTFVQLLRVAFWMLPVQRVLTGMGLLVIGSSLLPGDHPWQQRLSLPGSTLPTLFVGIALMLVMPLLLGGAWLRMLAAPRSLQLLPHARGRLLAGTIVIVLLATLVWIAAYWVAFQRAPRDLRPQPAAYALMYMLTLTFATQCAIGVFIASRGPIWMAVALIAWVAPHVVLPWLGVDDAARVLAGPVGVAMVAVPWTAFAFWFLRVRRIGGGGWGRASVEDAAHSVPANPLVLNREQAMTRWMLADATPGSIGLLWALCASVLVGMQLLIGHDSPPRAVAIMLFCTLSLNTVVVAAVAQSAAARSRGLWLHGARSRQELYGWCERLLLRVAVAILLPFVLLAAALWFWLPARPALPLHYMLPALVAPGLASLWFGLLMVRRSTVIFTLVALAIMAGWYFGIAQPLATGTTEPRWWVLIAQLGLVAALRTSCAHLWRNRDWLRGRRSEPMTG